MGFVAFLLFNIILISIRKCQAKQRSHVELVQEITSWAYDKEERPNTSPRDAEVVASLRIEVNALQKVDERNQEMSLDICLRLTWYDNRLRFPFDELKDEVTLQREDYSRIWYPGVFFPAATSVQNSHTKDTYLKIQKNGKVWLQERILLTLRCNLNYTSFPFDKQECQIKAQLFLYKINEVLLAPLEDPEAFVVRRHTDVKETFNITELAVRPCSANFSTADHHCLAFHMRFERILSHYMLYNVIPPGLLTILGYLTFYLSHPSSDIRAFLLTIIILLVCVHSTSVYLSADVPDLPYFTAFDIWITICTALMSLAFGTFFIVGRLCTKPHGLELPMDTKRIRCGIILDCVMRIIYPFLMAAAFTGYFLWLFIGHEK